MDRFWSKVKKSEGCWEWQASKYPTGYGHFRFEGKLIKAHRMAYTLTKGPIPDGLHVMHSCDNPACVNPDHLSVGTHRDNMKDRDLKGRCQRYNAGKTHCPKGHEYTEENTYWQGTSRQCKVCRHARDRSEYTREYHRAYRARKKTEKLAAKI